MTLLDQMINNYYRMSIKTFILLTILLGCFRVYAAACNATHPYAISTTCYLCTNIITKNVLGRQPNIILTFPLTHAKLPAHLLTTRLSETEVVFKVNQALFSMS